MTGLRNGLLLVIPLWIAIFVVVALLLGWV